MSRHEPARFSSKGPLRDEISKVFDCITPINPEHVIFG
jgi:hypothetical protein